MKLAARVVSLAGSADRRACVAADLANLPLPWAFLDACRADSPAPVAPDAARQRLRFGRALTPGEIGCYKSHLRALETFDADPALDWLLVLEDDVWLDTAADFAALVGWAEANGAGYLRLFARNWVAGRPVGRVGTRQILRLATDPYGTQAYLISRAAAAQFRAHVAGLGAIVRPVDDDLGRFWEHGLEPYAAFPFPAVERECPSLIEAGRESAAEARPPPSLARWRVKLADAAAKRLWRARRRFGIAGRARPAPPRGEPPRPTPPPRARTAVDASRGGA